ncbi:sugar phosphate isomerase/epimerase [Maribacter sp. ACAM166]|uniref:sugar phosphate isomerase/epimerase n=1 Tax=Maribacter sp. ACAM166 TaxID=2508996 RepID=UPI0010FD8841|nr:sugar phosphate isomerase/epimerase [Maribacter sp. ACAM166]TLP79168.1 sugar phosphate isomerase/epimerase [Maribacter sp. ACAM166]
MEHINYLYPYWGSEHLSATAFIALARDQGFQGIEINITNDKDYEKQFLEVLNTTRKSDPNFICVLQQVLEVKSETVNDYITTVLKRLERMLPFEPDFINSHTGKDYYSFDDNCRVIDAIETFSETNNIPVYHEIHRGRFTFHSGTTLSYLELYPQLKLVGDLSHWCVVSESMLQDQQHILKKIIPHIQHIHARVGFEQAPQVNHPFAPEWENYLKHYLDWWQRIINEHKVVDAFTITTEFGPYPYMPQAPFTKEPLANQHEINMAMKTYLENHLSIS